MRRSSWSVPSVIGSRPNRSQLVSLFKGEPVGYLSPYVELCVLPIPDIFRQYGFAALACLWVFLVYSAIERMGPMMQLFMIVAGPVVIYAAVVSLINVRLYILLFRKGWPFIILSGRFAVFHGVIWNQLPDFSSLVNTPIPGQVLPVNRSPFRNRTALFNVLKLLEEKAPKATDVSEPGN